VRFITYWFDEERSTAFCLVDAPNNRNAEILLHLRIVLSVDEFVEDDNDLFGATVQLASRLCEHATADQILAAEDVVKQSPNQKFSFPRRCDHAQRLPSSRPDLRGPLAR
jgi:class 3 adenylate cyclase